MIELNEPYRLAYLQSLPTIKAGHFGDLKIEDSYHRVTLDRLTKADGADVDHLVTIETWRGNVKGWKIAREYPASLAPPICTPANTGLNSTDRAIGSKLAAVLNSLGAMESHVATGSLCDELRALRLSLHSRLTADGWRIKASTTSDKWRVLAPKGGNR